MNLSFLRDLVTEKVSSDSWLPALSHSIPLGWQGPWHCRSPLFCGVSCQKTAGANEERQRIFGRLSRDWRREKVRGNRERKPRRHRRKVRAGPENRASSPLSANALVCSRSCWDAFMLSVGTMSTATFPPSSLCLFQWPHSSSPSSQLAHE